jgi:hypothetical protein
VTKLDYRFTYDTLFKMLFVKHPDLLKRLVAAILGIAVDGITEFIITKKVNGHSKNIINLHSGSGICGVSFYYLLHPEFNR